MCWKVLEKLNYLDNHLQWFALSILKCTQFYMPVIIHLFYTCTVISFIAASRFSSEYLGFRISRVLINVLAYCMFSSSSSSLHSMQIAQCEIPLLICFLCSHLHKSPLISTFPFHRSHPSRCGSSNSSGAQRSPPNTFTCYSTRDSEGHLPFIVIFCNFPNGIIYYTILPTLNILVKASQTDKMFFI